MKKTILVSVITSFITVILVMFLVHMFSYCCNEGSYDYDGKHKKECKIKDELKVLRAEFDQELNDEEKQIIKTSKANLEGFEHDSELSDEEYEADFNALATIAENHKESLDAIKAKFHDKHCGFDCCKPHKDCCDKHKACYDKHKKTCCEKHKKACCEKKKAEKCPEDTASLEEPAEHKEPGEHKESGEYKESGEHKCPEYKSCREKGCDHKACGHKTAEHKSPEKKACCKKEKDHKCKDSDTFGIHFLLMEY